MASRSVNNLVHVGSTILNCMSSLMFVSLPCLMILSYSWECVSDVTVATTDQQHWDAWARFTEYVFAKVHQLHDLPKSLLLRPSTSSGKLFYGGYGYCR